jgi:3-oxo-5-alpha-steroid 4-dehydrogenase
VSVCVQGAAVLTLGQLIQHTSHRILAGLCPRTSADTALQATSSGSSAPARTLRQRGTSAGAATAAPVSAAGASKARGKRAADEATDNCYVMPRGGVFEWVSCPHYLGEIVIYAGLAVAARCSGLSVAILAWVVRSRLPFGTCEQHLLSKCYAAALLAAQC